MTKQTALKLASANLPRRLGLRGSLLPVGWQLPDDLSEAEWREAGEVLGKVELSVSWWLGDWWRAFKPEWGERAALFESDWDGPAYSTCRHAGAVCDAFDIGRRRPNLTFKHHAEVASHDAAEADALLDWCEETAKPRSTLELRGEKNRRSVTIGAQPSGETCTVEDLSVLAASGRRFGCLYADPPWLYDNQGTRASTGNHYQGLTVDELCALPVMDLAADNAHLHLWITNAFLFDAPRIFAAWGFEFRSMFAWVKPQMGIGNYWRNSHEILLTAVRGDAKRFNDHSMISWMEFDRGVHSAKPQEVRAMVERASPGPYLEMFARSPVPNWTVWGNQIERIQMAAAAE
jgi:N6-adenosine-specific RNA methylase IME4